jgi:hypothetical protein
MGTMPAGTIDEWEPAAIGYCGCWYIITGWPFGVPMGEPYMVLALSFPGTIGGERTSGSVLTHCLIDMCVCLPMVLRPYTVSKMRVAKS